MTKIKNLDMAPAVSAQTDVTVRHSFFGLIEKATYNPTGSRICAHIYEYMPEDGEDLSQLLQKDIEQIGKEVQFGTYPTPTPVGHIRAEVCLSDDRQFAAVQMHRFTDFEYKPITPVKFFCGAEAEVVSRLFAKRRP